MTSKFTSQGYLVDPAKPYEITETTLRPEAREQTSTDRLFRKHDELCNKGRKLMVSKNHDYRGGSGDPYANFRSTEKLGVSPIKGILIRMSDKIMRVATFDSKGELQVKDEGLEDALIDIINYAVLIGGLVQEEKVNAFPDKE